MADEHRDVLEYQSDLAMAFVNLGSQQADAGDMDASLVSQRKATEIRERLVAAVPENVEYARHLANSYYNVAIYHGWRKDFAAAAQHMQKAADQQRKVAGKTTSTEDLLSLATELHQLWRYNLVLKQLPESSDWGLKALAILEKLAPANPKSSAVQKAYRDTVSDVIMSEQALGKMDSAERICLKRAEIAVALAAGDPSAPAKEELSEAHATLVLVQIYSGKPKEATASALRGLKTDPASLELRAYLAHALLLDGQFDKAKATYELIRNVKFSDNKTMGQVLLEQLAGLRKRGITHPDMEKIEAMLK